MTIHDTNGGAGDDLPGTWNDVRERVRERWPRLTTDDLDEIGGSRDRLVRRIELRYGVANEAASTALGEFLSSRDRAPAPDAGQRGER